MSDQPPLSPGFLNTALVDLTERVEQLETTISRTDDDPGSGTDVADRIAALEGAVAKLRRTQARDDADQSERRPWNTLTAEEAEHRWTTLHDWVRALIIRNAIGPKEIPNCWYVHNGLVDELEALRWAWLDANRPDAKGTEPLWWREVFARARLRLPLYNTGGCGVQHSPTTTRSLDDDHAWTRFLTRDLNTRPHHRSHAS